MKIAVVGILTCGDKVLLLRRTQPPVCWCPPGGGLNENEIFVDGVKREVLEETGISCRVLTPVDTWYGFHDNKLMQSITFVCESISMEVTLSDEHDAYCWVPVCELEQWKDRTDFDVSLWKKYIQTAKYRESLG